MCFVFFNDTATTEIYTLSLHDALPISEVKVVLHYDVPGGRLGRAVAKLFGEEPVQQVRDDLRRFKQVVETGDIVRSDGLPGGTHAKKQAVQRPAQPSSEERRVGKECRSRR